MKNISFKGAHMSVFIENFLLKRPRTRDSLQSVDSGHERRVYTIMVTPIQGTNGHVRRGESS